MKSNNNPSPTENISNNYSKALKMIDNYQSNHGKDNDFLASEYFDIEVIRNLIQNPKCKGIRIYNSLKDEDNKIQNRFILMAEDDKGKTILNMNLNLSAVSMAGIGTSIGLINEVAGIAENGRPCPPYCG